jgi:hypothetical protein
MALALAQRRPSADARSCPSDAALVLLAQKPGG